MAFKSAGGDRAEGERLPAQLAPGAGQNDSGMMGKIAIVGMSCRLPGDIHTPSALWDFLCEGRSARAPVPPSRFNAAAFTNAATPQEGYFLNEDVRAFDHDFFGILSAEATHMDPQQRKLLEIVYECLESAGISLQDVSGANVGCYVGNFTYDFLSMQTKDVESLHRYSATGMGSTILSNRISHAFNLTGPSLVIDTACSSSLYCLHTAVSALESGDCDSAIVASANLIQSIEQHLGMIKAGVISPTSTCHTFSDQADGYARAEGLGCLYLKRYDDAIRDRDPIRAVICGSAVGSNGKTGGISAPDAASQVRVIQRAYRKAGISPDATSYIECHGTGTQAGDPCEVEALYQVFRRDGTNPLLIGGIKPNLGHGEGVSGLTGVIKAVLALEHEEIPATIGVGHINPRIQADKWGIDIVTRHRFFSRPPPSPSSASRSPLRAGVNSFGYGGANSHVILEAPRKSDPSTPSTQKLLRRQNSFGATTGARTTYLLPLSASTQEGLMKRFEQIAGVKTSGDVSVGDLAYTLGCRRTHFSHRGFILINQSAASLDDKSITRVTPSYAQPASTTLPVAFIFTGQGAQWHSMGKELFSEFAVFRRAIRRLDKVLACLPERPDWSIEAAVAGTGPPDLVHRPACAQAMTVGLQIAIVELFASWDFTADFVIGHSSGEIAAAFAAGLITAAEAITAAFYRGLICQNSGQEGAMLNVSMTPDEAEQELADLRMRSSLRVACINSPENVTISGSLRSVNDLADHLTRRGVLARRLNTGGVAYHSGKVTPELDRLIKAAIPELPFSTSLDSRAQMISTVTATAVTGTLSPEYWRQNLESQVKFSQAVEQLIQNRNLQFIEIGPHGALELPLRQIRSSVCSSADEISYLSSITRNQNGANCVLNLMGQLFSVGHRLAFEKINECASSARVVHNLPPYPWQHDKILWAESRASHELRNRKHTHHELLGSLIPGTDHLTRQWRNTLRLGAVPWLSSHQIESTVVFPAAAYAAMGIEAFRQVALDESSLADVSLHLRSLKIHGALALDDTVAELFTTIRPEPKSPEDSNSSWSFHITCTQGHVSDLYAEGSISCSPSTTHDVRPFAAPKSGRPLCVDSSYKLLAKSGLNFGPEFRSLDEITVSALAGAHSACARLNPDAFTWQPDQSTYLVHPIAIDALLQIGIFAQSSGNKSIRSYLPVSVDKIHLNLPRILADPSRPQLSALTTVSDDRLIEVAAQMSDGFDSPIMAVEGVKMTAYSPMEVQQIEVDRNVMLGTSWRPVLPMSSWSCNDVFTAVKRLSATAWLSQSPIKDDEAAHVQVLSLLAHTRPNLKIMHLATDFYPRGSYLEANVRKAIHLGPQGSYSFGTIGPDGSLHLSDAMLDSPSMSEWWPYFTKAQQAFDVIVLDESTFARSLTQSDLTAMWNQLAPGGFIIDNGAKIKDLDTAMERCTLEDGKTDVFFKADNASSEFSFEQAILIVELEQTGETVTTLVENLANKCPVTTIKIGNLHSVQISAFTAVICLLEVETPWLSRMDDADMSNLRQLSSLASNLLWVTGAGMFSSPVPDFAAASGLARSLMLEQPALTFYTCDVPAEELDSPQTATNLLSILNQRRSVHADFEFAQKSGMLHVSRFSTSDLLNEALNQKLNGRTASKVLSEAEALSLPCENLQAIVSTPFEEAALTSSRDFTVPDDHVRIKLLQFGLATDDSGQLETGLVDRYAVITHVGSAVQDIKSGDFVVFLTTAKIMTHQVVPASTCHKVPKLDKVDCPKLSCYATAFYALHHRANMKAGQSMLVLGGGSVIGRAAQRIATSVGLHVSVIVRNGWEVDHLQAELGSSKVKIIKLSELEHWASQLGNDRSAFDYLVNTGTLDAALDSLTKVLSPTGTWLNLGSGAQRRYPNLGESKGNYTFITVDLSSLLSHSQTGLKILSEVLPNCVGLISAETTRPVSEEIYDVAKMHDALDDGLSRAERSITISLEDSTAVIDVVVPKFSIRLSTQKTYIILGGTGGIGQSITRWMISRGATNFVLMSRSGLSSERTAASIQSLSASGTNIQVLQGNIENAEDVQRAVDAAQGPIGGVVHAAMALSESVFATMSADAWHTALGPKLRGCWNLHNAIAGRDTELDFFLTLSSVSGSVGQIAQSNYCAANHCLDWFARYRRSLSLPATAVALGMVSEVGYLHENPDVASKLGRSGISSIDEEEMLQIIDTALAATSDDLGVGASRYDHLAASHVLTGLEAPSGQSLPAGPASANVLAGDPRAGFMVAATNSSISCENTLRDNSIASDNGSGSADTATPDVGTDAVLELFAQLLEMDVADIDTSKSLVDLGVDSMVGTELRNWCFKTYAVDVSLFKILSRGTTTRELLETVTRGSA